MSTCTKCGATVYLVPFGSAGKIPLERAPRVFSITGDGVAYVYASPLFIDHNCTEEKQECPDQQAKSLSQRFSRRFPSAR